MQQEAKGYPLAGSFIWKTHRQLDDRLMREIHRRALQIAEEVGLEVANTDALRRLADLGVRVELGRAYLAASMIEDYLKDRRCRRAETDKRESPAARRGCDGDEGAISMAVAPGAHFEVDLDTDEIVPVTTERFIQQMKLTHAAKQAGMRIRRGPSPIPVHVPHAMIPLVEFLVTVEYSDFPPFYNWSSPQKTGEYLREMHRAIGDASGGPGRSGRSGGDDVLTPLRLGGDAFDDLVRNTDQYEAWAVSTHGMVGANLPVRPFSAAALTAAEALASATAIWLLMGGKTVDFSLYMCAFDVRHLTQLYNGPEEYLFGLLLSHLSAFYDERDDVGVGPGDMSTTAKRPGFQAGMEKMAAVILSVVRGANYFDSAGTLSGMEVFSGEQLILDWDICCYAERLRQGLAPEDSERWLAEVKEGLATGYTGTDTTLDHYREVYWQPEMLDRMTLMSWRGKGEPEVRAKARARAKDLLASYHYEPDEDVVRELRRIVEHAEKELG